MPWLRAALSVLLIVVAGAAAVLSFTTLRDLALACGFAAWTAPLLPLVVDAGAAAGTLTWLSRTGPARTYGQVLALSLLGLSVVGNAIGHALSAEQARPGLALVVAVSAVAPAVLGAVVHLAMLTGRAQHDEPDQSTEEPDRSGEPSRPAGLSQADEDALVAQLTEAVRSGQSLPSGNHLIETYGIGRGRANRILGQAAADAEWTGPRAVRS